MSKCSWKSAHSSDVGSDGRPTGVGLEIPSDEEDGRYSDADGISAPFRPDSIRIHTETTTVDLLLSRLREGMIDKELYRARSLLFVAATRARDALAITWHGEPSRFLAPLLPPQ